jgi:predicted metal-dependent hydrolase
MENITKRTIMLEGQMLEYTLERKSVKNVNLHVRKDGSVYVSANARVAAAQIDDFLISKSQFILKALNRFREQAEMRPQPKQYVSGETFYIQGRALRLKVVQAAKNQVYTDGVHIFLELKDLSNKAKRQRMVCNFLDQQCRDVFGEVVQEIYPVFQKYGVTMPVIRIRDMDTRWGSCLVKKGVITLNKRLLEAPRNCIEYVVMHEFCHFIHPNHSKHFYGLLSMLMPDWKDRKKLLENYTTF